MHLDNSRDESNEGGGEDYVEDACLPAAPLLNTDSTEHKRLVEDLWPMSHREMRQASVALEAEHPRTDSAKRKGDLVKILSGKFSIPCVCHMIAL